MLGFEADPIDLPTQQITLVMPYQNASTRCVQLDDRLTSCGGRLSDNAVSPAQEEWSMRRSVIPVLVIVATLALVRLPAMAAQEATPSAVNGPDWLVVQAFAAATLRPDPSPGIATLTITDVDAAVVAFTDRPERAVALVPTPDFVRAVAEEQADPLNAALVVPAAEGQAVTVVVELLGAEYDPATGTVTYRVRALGGEDGALTNAATPRAASDREQAFGPGHLFIDAVQVPAHVPVNVCGNSVNVIGVLNPSFGNTCENA